MLRANPTPSSASPETARYRAVSRFVDHGAPLDFRAMCERTIPRETRFLVLDLDRTTHLARNMGELLGWEICAWHGYGAEHLLEIDPSRPRSRFVLDASSPASLARYLSNGTRMWAYPGLFYFLFGKLASRIPEARRWTFRAFGPEPVRAVQWVPQIAMMHHMSELPLATLRMLAARVFERYGDDQIVERSDLEWLRTRCPDLRIVISSASPQPVLEAASDVLGVDEIVYSEIEAVNGALSAPWYVDPRLMRNPLPHRLAAPSTIRINTGRAKITELLRRHPEIAEPGVVSVGITDNGYGEDQSWAECFTRVVAVNTTSPFSPVVTADSATEEIHSASVLTRRERRERASGRDRYVDPRRASAMAGTAGYATGAELSRRFATTLATVDEDARRCEAALDAARPSLERIDARARELTDAIEAQVARYNDESPDARAVLVRELRTLARRYAAIDRERASVLSEVSACSFRIARGIEAVSSAVRADDPSARDDARVLSAESPG